MKISLLAGALLTVTFGYATPIALAQEAPAQVRQKSAYEIFLEANASLKDGPNGEPSTTETLTPDENLRRQRLAVARNARALAKLREALQMGVVIPNSLLLDEASSAHMESMSAARELARQLEQEAAVRAADDDAMGAAQSSLDTLNLATQVARGPYLHATLGSALSAMARRSLQQHGGALSAAQLREAAAQWQKIAARTPTYSQVLRDEETVILLRARPLFRSAGVGVPLSVPAILAFQEAMETREFSEKETAEIRQFLRESGELPAIENNQGPLNADEIVALEQYFFKMRALTMPELEADLRAIFDQALQRAVLPYNVATKAEPIRAQTTHLALTADLVNAPQTRLSSVERNRALNRLFVAALQLRAIKLESGQYPATFDAGADPFSPTLAPLIYRRAGESYVLYSVGPDGKDDNGGEIQTLVTNRETGVKSVSDRLQPDSSGDIVVPVL